VNLAVDGAIDQGCGQGRRRYPGDPVQLVRAWGLDMRADPAYFAGKLIDQSYAEAEAALAHLPQVA
jgi:hypothetical protein